MAEKVLVTGGAGYIGSTVASACLDAGMTPVVLDDFSTGRLEFVADRLFFAGDIADGSLLRRIFTTHPDISTVIHCAARIVVPESMGDPLGYYRHNVGKTLEFLAHLDDAGCRNIVFSSSASIYAPSNTLEVDEQSSYGPTSPYARTKLMLEQVLADLVAVDFRSVSLRYFNPIGADPQLRTGLQHPEPTHALGKILTADRTGRPFTITGTDWQTRDGTGIRDYVHVWDLALAHVAAVRRFDQVAAEHGGNVAINLGTGSGTTVRELVRAFERVTGRTLPVVETERRPGDAAGAFTRSRRALDLLEWTPDRSIEEGIADSLRWAAVTAERLWRPEQP